MRRRAHLSGYRPGWQCCVHGVRSPCLDPGGLSWRIFVGRIFMLALPPLRRSIRPAAPRFVTRCLADMNREETAAELPPMKTVLSRRQFLNATAVTTAALACPTLIPASVLGQGAPSKRLNIGCIGVGPQGRGVMSNFLAQKDCRVLALCDVSKRNLEEAVKMVNGAYPDAGVVILHDYRESDRPEGHRRRAHRHAGPLARAGGRRRRPGREGHVRREADGLVGRRRTRCCGGSARTGRPSSSSARSSGPASSSGRRASSSATAASGS